MNAMEVTIPHNSGSIWKTYLQLGSIFTAAVYCLPHSKVNGYFEGEALSYGTDFWYNLSDEQFKCCNYKLKHMVQPGRYLRVPECYNGIVDVRSLLYFSGLPLKLAPWHMSNFMNGIGTLFALFWWSKSWRCVGSTKVNWNNSVILIF